MMDLIDEGCYCKCCSIQTMKQYVDSKNENEWVD